MGTTTKMLFLGWLSSINYCTARSTSLARVLSLSVHFFFFDALTSSAGAASALLFFFMPLPMTKLPASSLVFFLSSASFFALDLALSAAAMAATSSLPTSVFFFFFPPPPSPSPPPALPPPPSPPSSLGATKASCLRFCDALSASFCFSNFSAAARRRLASCDRKYSPDSICRSTLDGVAAGGNTVSFLPLPTLVGTLRLTFFFLNLGRKRSQLWPASSGSLASSRLIMSSLMW
mmetsp:Transcript_31108/g.77406  ORF Transcript_31108/g.77406 Transcript_31108/m.77406 type:complete len:234 (+) Transcript_31108:500-1201(+)